DSKKIQLIEEVLRLDDNIVLKELESILKKSKKAGSSKKSRAHDFLGQWSRSDAVLIEKAIADGCEQIQADEWR
ncbi:MAG: hypothetical protein K2U26_10685, partial [Cyclobacteriaceae bacterium]|nr:hypothetical protein [Cyclobacteriaceae bacterium]